MEYVEPIRDKRQIANMERYLKERNERDYVLLRLGINSGLRISDLISLRVDEVRGRDRISIREAKTGKTKDFPLSEKLQKMLKDYIAGIDSNWLFPSRKGDGHITRVQAYRIINAAAKEVGVPGQIGTHTLRKTFGYWAYQMGVDISRIQKLLNHSAPSVTLAYIGITKEELDQVYINLDL